VQIRREGKGNGKGGKRVMRESRGEGTGVDPEIDQVDRLSRSFEDDRI